MQEVEQIAPNKSVAFVDIINRITASKRPFEACVNELGEYLPDDVRRNIEEILSVTNQTVKNGKVVFDVTLVRGMGYYTGTIYEVAAEGLSSAIAGGGRYDKMIGRLTGQDVPACGFSIGFERIVLLMQERGATVKYNCGAAVLLDKKTDVKTRVEVMQVCAQMRKKKNVTVFTKIKNFGYQLKQLREQGYVEIYEYRNGALNLID